MSRGKPKVDDLTQLAAEVGREDGSDPRDFHAKPWNAPKQASRKGQQLCSQVKEALHTAFGACADPVLQVLAVAKVEPAPHTGRLLVIVSAGDEAERSEVVAALARGAGFLRAEVAKAVSRRYVPELVFDLL